ncbi:MAG TPA: magnesium-translocating P-type ATPase [Patescibacteria group bacterium]|nr:magnesium-translocating P-type ATPase [Patescibacteria group bacterium]
MTTQEAERLLKVNGPNAVDGDAPYNVFQEGIRKLLNPLNLILLFSTGISALLGQITDFIIIGIILCVSVAIDVIQESSADSAARKLREHVSFKARVFRDGKWNSIPVRNLVVGDLIELRTGDIVPADCDLESGEHIEVSEAALTGESLPIQKTDRLLAGSSVTSGLAKATVKVTGKETQFGKLAKQLTMRRPPTEFEKGTHAFGVLIIRLTMALVLFVFFVNALAHHNILEALLFSLSIAIGMAPELLPVILSITLAKGAARMAKKNVIVKHLPSIELFGSMDVLCTDKTGTLTQDKISLERYEDLSGEESQKVLDLALIHGKLQSSFSNPLELAVLAHDHSGINAKLLAELPFDFERRCSSVVAHVDKKTLLITKGAPESLFAISRLTTIERNKLEKRFNELSEKGFRVLGLATREVDERKTYEKSDEKNLHFVGFLCFLDPPKETVNETLQLLAKQGIKVKILTGDNELVTRKICSDIGMEVDKIQNGTEVETWSDEKLQKEVEKIVVFARLNPEQKERIILALKNNNHVVGFLGDGINDAPSLRTADVGISVNNATDVAKAAADIILLRKSLRVVSEGVSEGRRTYFNISKYILMGTSSNLGNMVSVAGASLFLPFLPMLPTQILLNDLLYDLSELAVPTDNVDVEELAMPRKWDVGFIKRFTLVFGPLSSIFDFVTFGLLFLLHANAPLFQTAWFIESLCSQVCIIFVIRTKRIPFWKSKPSGTLIASSLLVAAIALLLPLTPIGTFFMFHAPKLISYAAIGGIIFLYMLMVETAKYFFFKKVSSRVV